MTGAPMAPLLQGASNMTRLAPRAALLAAAAVLALAPLALAADAPKAVGTWDLVAKTPDGDMPSVLTVKAAEGGVKAGIELNGAARTVTDEKLEGAVLKLKVEYEGTIYDVEAKIAGDTLEGTWMGGGNSGALSGKRRP
jgi:hypothetical protein